MVIERVIVDRTYRREALVLFILGMPFFTLLLALEWKNPLPVSVMAAVVLLGAGILLGTEVIFSVEPNRVRRTVRLLGWRVRSRVFRVDPARVRVKERAGNGFAWRELLLYDLERERYFRGPRSVNGMTLDEAAGLIKKWLSE